MSSTSGFESVVTEVMDETCVVKGEDYAYDFHPNGNGAEAMENTNDEDFKEAVGDVLHGMSRALKADAADPGSSTEMTDEEFDDFKPLLPEAGEESQEAAAPVGEEAQVATNSTTGSPASSGKKRGGSKAKAAPAAPAAVIPAPEQAALPETMRTGDGKTVTIKDAKVPNTPADAPEPPRKLSDEEKAAQRQANSVAKSAVALEKSSVPVSGLVSVMSATTNLTFAQLATMVRGYSDDDLIILDAAAKDLGQASWRMRAGVRGEVVRRTAEKIRQASIDPQTNIVNSVIEAKITTKAMKASADQLGISVRILYQDADINEAFFLRKMKDPETGAEITAEQIEAAVNIFDEKSFLVACLAGRPDQRVATSGGPNDNLPNGYNPQAIFCLLSTRKIDNPNYSVRDCERDVELIKQNRIAAALGKETLLTGEEGAPVVPGTERAGTQGGKQTVLRIDLASMSPDAGFAVQALVQAAQTAKAKSITQFVYRNQTTGLYGAFDTAPILHEGEDPLNVIIVNDQGVGFAELRIGGAEGEEEELLSAEDIEEL